MKKERYIGIMSGTSLDGIDVVLCEIDAHSCELVDSFEYLFPEALKEQILKMIEGSTTLAEVSELDHVLGVQYASVVKMFLVKVGVSKEQISAIGLHGQTLWHAPNAKYPATMQLGDANIVTAQTGIPVVADFRRKDVALGGQGAPFAPAFHEFIFKNIKEGVSVVNIGGMANITVLGEKLIGYDTGCGNVLLDMWIAKHKGVAYDKDGEWSRLGNVDYVLLDAMMADAYFTQPYPKSTGREKFNEAWLDHMIARRGEPMCSPNVDEEKNTISINQFKGEHMGSPLRKEDVQRTLLELTALSISNEVLKFNRDLLVLCGGGAKNAFLVERIKALMPNVEVLIAEHADALEAMLFAWLAYKRVHKEVVNLKDVTGASENAVLGGLYE